jgi:hypothetical protein
MPGPGMGLFIPVNVTPLSTEIITSVILLLD